jgi:thioredoxin 2
VSEAELDDRGVILPCPKCGQKNRIAYERVSQPVRCGTCKHEMSPPAAPVEITRAADFDRLVALASVPVVVDFWAPWCGPCRMVAPELQKVAARQAGRMLIVKVNTDAVGELGDRFGIRSIPTLAVFANGREVARTGGARPAADIEAFVDQAVQAAHR